MTKKNVKSYFNTVGSRLKKAFTIEAFDLEQELEFWALCAEHSSRDYAPTFVEIAKWVDLLYQAPVHVVYRKEKDKLHLLRRKVFSKNFSFRLDAFPDVKEEQDQHEKELIQQFEQRLQNLEQKKDWDEIFLEHGKSTHSIGSCEHIPLYDSNGDFWGIYMIGPYVESPQEMKPKLTIIGRLLSQWLIKLEQVEVGPQKNYQRKINKVFGDLGTGRLNTEGIANILNNYFAHITGATASVILKNDVSKNRILASKGFNKEIKEEFKNAGDDALLSEFEGVLKESKTATGTLAKYGIKHYTAYPFEKGCLFLSFEDEFENLQLGNFIQKKSSILSALIEFEKENTTFSEKLTNTYYDLLRRQEMSIQKTQYHTPRMMALAEKFSSFFGLNEQESEIIKISAKLHDIGYIGSPGLEKSKSVGSEINHPLIGAFMLEKLPLHQDVISAVKSHHEWINGRGEPNQLKGEEISWSGKIIGLLEFIVEYIESNLHAENKHEKELQEQLVKELMSRADRQFDLVIVPTAIQMINALGWKGCTKLGTSQS